MEATLQSPFGQTVLEPGVVTIGSAPDSQLVVHDAKVSPHHAVVRSTEQGYTITDWWSTEGTFVNEQRLEPTIPRLLTAGDRLRIGEKVFTYEVHEGAALVAGQGSRPKDEPTVLAAPSEHSAYGAGAKSSSVLPAQTKYGSVPSQESAPAQSTKSAATSGGTQIGAGLVLCVMGIILTIISYSSASPGGTYFVFWGLILVGIINIVAGLARLSGSKGTIKTKEQWLNEGLAHRKAGRYQEAIAAYDHAIALNPKLAVAHYNAGKALQAMGRTNTAQQAFATARQLGYIGSDIILVNR